MSCHHPPCKYLVAVLTVGKWWASEVPTIFLYTENNYPLKESQKKHTVWMRLMIGLCFWFIESEFFRFLDHHGHDWLLKHPSFFGHSPAPALSKTFFFWSNSLLCSMARASFCFMNSCHLRHQKCEERWKPNGHLTQLTHLTARFMNDCRASFSPLILGFCLPQWIGKEWKTVFI